MNEEVIKNFKQLNDRINEIHKRLDDIAISNKSMLEDAIIELAAIIEPQETEV
jgi:hypothetical protein